jgi:membrane-bound lytic murein transglycosylase B
MNRSITKLALLLLALLATAVAFAQNAAPAKEPPRSLVSIYRIATGKQAEFLKWMAVRDAVDKDAGIPRAQWYAHTDGDSWDYIAVGPAPTPEQDKKVEALMKKQGLATGFKQSLEVRQFIASHTDTFAVGPVTVSELADWAK